MWLIIGISGATCSGKSSLAKSLHKNIPGSVLICQDDFFLPEDSKLHTFIPDLKHNNWEILTSLDMEKMHETVNNILQNHKSATSLDTLQKVANEVIDKETRDTADQSLECYEDRSATISENNASKVEKYSATESASSSSEIKIFIIEGFIIFNDKQLADLCQKKYFLTLNRDECWARRSVRTYNPADVPGYFDQCVWPHYEKHRDIVFEQCPDILKIDGTLSRQFTFKKVLLDILETAKMLLNKDM